VTLNLVDLNERVRQFMVDELNLDLEAGTLYRSERLTEDGWDKYHGLLRDAVVEGNDESLAQCLRSGKCMVAMEMTTRRGKLVATRVPVNACQTLAEGEFNRFYLRGLCRCATEDGIDHLIIYRAKQVRQPRPDSFRLLGKAIDAHALLERARADPRVDLALGLPHGPNSGLSARLP